MALASSLASLLLFSTSSSCTLCPNGAAPRRLNHTIEIPESIVAWMNQQQQAEATAAANSSSSSSDDTILSSLPRVTCRELAKDIMYFPVEPGSDNISNSNEAETTTIIEASAATPGSLWACALLQTLFADPCGCLQPWTCDFVNDPCPHQGDGICRDYSSKYNDDDVAASTGTGSSTAAGVDDDKNDDTSASKGQRQSKAFGVGRADDGGAAPAAAVDDDGADMCTSVQADCYDCDPCRQYSFTSCDVCTSAQVSIAAATDVVVDSRDAVIMSNDVEDDDHDHVGRSRSSSSRRRPACLWCPGDAVCSSYPYSRFPPAGTNGTCASSHDWIQAPETCPSHSNNRNDNDNDNNSTTRNGTTSVRNESDPAPVTPAKEASSMSSQQLQNWFNDPLVDSQQWIFDMIHVAEVWVQNVTGAGVTIRINDDGIDSTHPELAGRFDANRSCDSYQFVDSVEDWHGTAVASIALGQANNRHCGLGIANGATLSACKVMGNTGTEVPLPQALTVKLDQHDISSNSNGISACRLMTTPTTGTTDASGGNSGGTRKLQESCPFRPGASELPCSACGYGGGSSTTTSTTTSNSNDNANSTSKQGTSDRPENRESGDDDNIDDRDLWYRDASEAMDDSCLQAIVDYCSVRLNYEQDDKICVHVLERFTSCQYNALPEDYQAELERGVALGRNGKGLIFVFAAGNDYSLGGYTNFEGLGNSRYVISVGAVDKFGYHASYSTPGASVFLVAPGGDTDVQTGYVAAALGGGCGNVGSGSSFATPVVSGVVALMLQVNPTLSWRDVQGVLATTSHRVDTTDPSWTKNAAGYWHSYKYGFGIVHASDAVRAVRNWQKWGNESVLSGFSGVINAALDDDDLVGGAEDGGNGSSTSGTLSSMTIKGNMTLESVVVYVDVRHSTRGHLRIKLTSPHGTESVLTPGERPENTQSSSKVRWKLMTLRSWGETSAGTWTLTLEDTESGDLGGDCVDHVFDDDSSLDYDCNRVYSELDMQGLTPDSACQDPILADKCCFCGGGTPRSSFNNSLVSWTIVLYGRDLDLTDILQPDTSSDDARDYASKEGIHSPRAGDLIGGGSHGSNRSQENLKGNEPLKPMSSVQERNATHAPVPELLFTPALPGDPLADEWHQSSSQELRNDVGHYRVIFLWIGFGALRLLL